MNKHENSAANSSTGYVLDGTVILGAPGTGKTFLMQHLALDLLRDMPEHRLIFVTESARKNSIIEGRCVGADVEESTGLRVITAERMAAFLCDADYGGEERAEVRRVKNAILSALVCATEPEPQGKFILAIDEVFAFFRSEEAREELWQSLIRALEAPKSALTLLVTFQSLTQLYSGFGKKGIELFARMREKYIFKYLHPDELTGFANCGAVDTTSLKRGQAVHLLQDKSKLINVGIGG